VSKAQSAKAILRAVSRGLQKDLLEMQRNFVGQISVALDQFERQADSAYDGKSWSEVSWPEFADRWEALIKAQTELLKRLRSKELPQWGQDQRKAYKESAIGVS